MNTRKLQHWAVVVGLALAIVLAWMGTVESQARQYSLDASAQAYVDAGLKRALVTFAAARGLNAFLSLAQSADLSFQPLGIGVEVGVGQLLRPVNDLVSQFAELMLAASVVFAAMEIMIRIGGHWVVTLALSIVGVAVAYRHLYQQEPPGWLGRFFVILLVLRFAVPVISIVNEGIYRAFMADEYASSQKAIQVSSEQIEAEAAFSSQPGAQRDGKAGGGGWFSWFSSKPASESQAAPQATGGMLERLKEWIAQKGDVTARLKKLSQVAESITEHVIHLMVVFLLQTLVIPLLLGWGLLRLLGLATRALPGHKVTRAVVT